MDEIAKPKKGDLRDSNYEVETTEWKLNSSAWTTWNTEHIVMGGRGSSWKFSMSNLIFSYPISFMILLIIKLMNPTVSYISFAQEKLSCSVTGNRRPRE